MKKILIPTDFSLNAMNAIVYSLKLFEHEFCKFYLLHTYQQEIYESGTAITKENLVSAKKEASENSQKQLDSTLKAVKKISITPKHSYKIVSANNILIDEVDLLVDEKDIDLVVMGTRGNTNDKNLTFGSHTLQVLKYIKCPVLVIPEKYEFCKPEQIVFSVDFFTPYQKRELELLSEIASDYQSLIDIIYVSKINRLSSREENNKRLIKETLRNNKKAFITVDNGEVTSSIASFIKTHDTDMLAIVNTRHSYLGNLLFQDNVDKIGLSIDIPLLVFQNIQRK